MEQGAKDKGQRARGKGQRARNKGQGTRGKEQGARNKGQGKRNKEQGTRNKGKGQGIRGVKKERELIQRNSLQLIKLRTTLIEVLKCANKVLQYIQGVPRNMTILS